MMDITAEGICFNTAVSEFEKALILKSLEMTNGVKNRAAKLLHLNRTTLVEKIKKHQLQKVCSA
jgi:DNA-binding NtrC family response regulator